MRFLLESLADLDASLRKLNSRLIVLHGDPVEALPAACKEWSASRLAYELDYEQYSLRRDKAVRSQAEQAGLEVVTRVGHTLVDPEALLLLSRGAPVTSYDKFRGLLAQELKARPVTTLPPPASLPPPGRTAAPHAIPSLEELGLEPMGDAAVIARGGEGAALRAMEAHLRRRDWIASFEKPKTSPTEMLAGGPFDAGAGRSTTVLSPYLTFGCLSSRLLYERVAAVYAEAAPRHSQPPVSLHGQLLWREFYVCCMHATPNYRRMAGNPICRQISWGEDAALVAAWREGRTGYPWIDAAMTQLRREGWIHHLARHAVACFLTRGDLWQSWETGAAVFEEYLLDADEAINFGNWMWLSCSCFFYQYFRCYSPVAFPQKYDKQGAYVRHWLPQLARLPAKYIYEPWKAPIAVQKEAGCIIGVDYPKPIVDHQAAAAATAAAPASARPLLAPPPPSPRRHPHDPRPHAPATRSAGGVQREYGEDGRGVRGPQGGQGGRGARRRQWQAGCRGRQAGGGGWQAQARGERRRRKAEEALLVTAHPRASPQGSASICALWVALRGE